MHTWNKRILGVLLASGLSLSCNGGGDDGLTNLILLAAIAQSQQAAVSSTCQGVLDRYGITGSEGLTVDVAGNYAPGEALVRFAEGVDRTQAQLIVQNTAGQAAALRSLSGSKQSAPGNSKESADNTGAREAGLQVVSIGALSVEDAVASFQKDPNVVSAQPNYVYRALDTTPNDADFGNLWGLNNTGFFNSDPNSNPENDTCVDGLSCYDMDAPEAWDTINDCGTAVVAVLDSGTNYNQEDLSGNMWTSSEGERGCDFIEADADPQDKNRHGTHVAGTIGASGNNGTGITGVCWKVQLMPVRVLGATGGGTTAQLIAGIDFAVENGAHVINLSLGGSSGSNGDELSQAIERARDAGVLVVAAAGNSAADNDSTNIFPANYSLDNIISVAALSQDGSLASFSNFGDQSVDIGAPGVSVFSSFPGDYTQITDDFESGIGSWTSAGNAGNWAITDISGDDYLNDPSDDGPSSTDYNNNWDTTAYRSYDFSAGDVVTFSFLARFDIESSSSGGCFDTAAVVTSAGGGVPSTNVGGFFCGDTGSQTFGFARFFTDAAGVSSYSAGFNLTTDASQTRGGVAVDDVEAEYLTYTTNAYEFLDGTSMATPHVAGLAALLKARNPDCTYSQIRDAILNGADTGGDSSKIANGRQAKIPGALTQIDAASCN